eukprot:6785827-Pyramimonas_sp.AAC.1
MSPRARAICAAAASPSTTDCGEGLGLAVDLVVHGLARQLLHHCDTITYQSQLLMLYNFVVLDGRVQASAFR